MIDQHLRVCIINCDIASAKSRS